MKKIRFFLPVMTRHTRACISVLALLFNVINSFVHYFGGQADKATFWMFCALFCYFFYLDMRDE